MHILCVPDKLSSNYDVMDIYTLHIGILEMFYGIVQD